MDGTIIRQSSFNAYLCASYADIYGRVLLNDHGSLELLDSEFNLLNFTGPQLGAGQFIFPFRLRYNSGRNEVVAIVNDQNFPKGLLTIFHLREE